MDPLYYFMLAAVLASFGISFAVRNAFAQIAEGKISLTKIQSKLMIYVALVETLPIILLVLGFMNIDDAQLNPVILIAVVGGSVLFNFVMNFVRYRDAQLQVEDNPVLKQQLSTTFLLSLGLVNAIPVIAIVAAFL
ncbi:hypothetical protein GCM10008967_33040 [Bacillus carboniphilus]|uniref:V-ATPase proteolipid subunit C-like domain-containing protein n=1 Tax=Bacillus carboniphilus TaxID=86663 RepID=A0ABP3GBY4_9BACI